MKNESIVAVDLGKHDVKLLTEYGKKLKVRSKIDVSNDVANSMQTYTLLYDQKRYLVGEEGKQSDYTTDKAVFFHKICLYTALGAVTEHTKAQYYLALTCPINLFKDKDYRDKFKHYFLTPHTTEILLNNTPKVIQLLDIRVYPESIGYIITNKNVGKKLIGVIDIGGLNTNAAIYHGIVPIRESIFTINEGSYILLNKIKNVLNSKGHNVQDYELPFIIHDERYKIDVDRVMIDHLISVREEMLKNSWNLKSIELHFIGGGSLLLSAYIESVFGSVFISPTADFDNVKACLALGIQSFKGGV